MMESIKNFLLLRWYGPHQKPEKVPRTTCAPQIKVKKLRYLEKDLPLPKEFRLNPSQTIFNVLCEDAVVFYTVRRPQLQAVGPHGSSYVLAHPRKQHNSIRALVYVLNPRTKVYSIKSQPDMIGAIGRDITYTLFHFFFGELTRALLSAAYVSYSAPNPSWGDSPSLLISLHMFLYLFLQWISRKLYIGPLWRLRSAGILM